MDANTYLSKTINIKKILAITIMLFDRINHKKANKVKNF